MHKFKIIIFLLFLTNYTLSQESSYLISYKLFINSDDNQKKNEVFSNYIKMAKKGAESLNFSLKTNSDFSEFAIESNGILSEEQKIAIVFSNYIGKCIYDFNNKINYIKIEDESIFKKDEFIIKDSLAFDWKITSETKKISEYECIKATKKILKNKSDSKKDIEVVVWFCPNLSINSGPNGYAGLPGLILELNINNIAFVVDKIIKKDVKEIIEIPKNGKYISFVEYNNIIRSRMLKFEDK
jgi:GLPGLI family protein